MSNHKGCGMASKERLYELWMLYYTKVSASAEELTVTPVVAAGPQPEVYNDLTTSTRGSVWSTRQLVSYLGNIKLEKAAILVCVGTSCLFTLQQRLPCAWIPPPLRE